MRYITFYLLDGWHRFNSKEIMFQGYESDVDFFMQGRSWTCRVLVLINKDNTINDFRFHLECYDLDKMKDVIDSFKEYFNNLDIREL